MKKLLLIFMTLVSYLFTAQVKDPVKVDFKINSLGDNVYEAVFHAKIDNGWHIYSKDLPPDSGIPTEITVSGDGVELVGSVEERGEKIDEYSEAFKARIVYYSNTVDIVQKFKLTDPSKVTEVEAEIYYQTCDDKICLAPNTLVFQKKIENGQVVEAAAAAAENAGTGDDLRLSNLKADAPLTDCGIAAQESSENYWSYLLLGFIGGLIALLTPCVFPMIPLTVSFFTKSADKGAKGKGKKDALLYGFFILLIFVLLSVPFHLIDGIAGNIFNEISTSVWLNIFFFVIFLFFAGSFFGYYDITLPSAIANKSSRAEEAGGLIGIFFMALTLVIVSFSCTGPILGSLLGSAVTGSSDVPMLLTFALAGFGFSWAIVFGLLALFPQALQSLPKSGGWMNTVKVVLGFIELGLALKFLSKADLVTKTFLLKRELFIVLWIIITIGLVLYLFGLIRFPHDDRKPKISTGRKIFGLISVAFLVYLIQGLIPSEKPKLQMLSGILPPLNVSYFHDADEGLFGLEPKHDFDAALAEAAKQNKPILIDFTGYGCENCRKMEEFVWNQPDVLPLLQNEFILASLYVDDKEALPEADQKMIDMGNGKLKKMKSIGDKWSLFQQINFNNNSQPHYVLLTPDGQLINTPVSGYMPKEDFRNFLQCGLDYFKNNYNK